MKIKRPIFHSFFAVFALALLTGCPSVVPRDNEPAPSITGFSPADAAHGDVLTISGRYFSAVPSGNSVTLNGVAATVISAMPNEIKVTVPDCSVTPCNGPVRVTVSGKTAVSATPFLYSLGISGFSPAEAAHGATLTIKGKGFSTVPSENSVTLNGVPAVVTSATLNELKITVPKNKSSTGPVQVTAFGRTVVSSTSFTYLPMVTVSTYADGFMLRPRSGQLNGITIDTAGNLYVAASEFERDIYKISPSGGVSIFVRRDPQFSRLSGITIDAAGNLYVVDIDGHRIYKISPSGVVDAFAGYMPGYAEGIGRNARFFRPSGITIDIAGNLYVTDTDNYRVRKISPSGEVSTLAGGRRGRADGIGDAAQFEQPLGITIDAVGNLYVVEHTSRVRKISPSGKVSTLVPELPGAVSDSEDITIDAAGNLYVTGAYASCIYKISPSGEVSILVRGPEFMGSYGITTDAADNLYVRSRGTASGGGVLKITIE